MIKLVKSTFFEEADTKKKLAKFILAEDQLSFGNQCETFEKKFAAWQKRKHCVFVNSGSSANLAILQAYLNLNRIKKNDLIGFSALTWSTNVMPIMELGLTPIPIDVEINTLNVSSRNLKKILEKYPLKMLFITNLLGFCDDIDEIRKICRKEKIILIEDNCESLGTVYKGKLLGNYGLASTFSFYVGHHMSTIEGGAICTDDDKLANMLRIVRAHGWDRNLNSETQTTIRTKHKVNLTFYSRYTFYDNGYNLRPTEINGFIGNTQIAYLDKIIKKRNENYFTITKDIYTQEEKYYPIKSKHIEFLSNFAIPIICQSQEIRDSLVAKCTDIIEIRPIVGGDMTKQPFFLKNAKTKLGKFKNPNAALIHKQGLYIGNNPELTKEDIKTIIKIFTTS
jgi:CDP-6-deoxy-D-xylo-4-hexulose-3-dehydrase